MTFRITSYWRKNVWLLTIILILGACAKKSKPAGILTRDQMVKAMVEIYTAEQKVNKLSLDTDSSQIVFDKIKGRIFDHIGVPDSVFKKSYDYYLDRPVQLEVIYTALVDTLNLYEQRSNLSRVNRENLK